jgi:hypothetical protein
MNERVPARSWLWPAAIIVAAACGFCWPVLAGRIMLPADMCLLMIPWRELQDHFGFTRPHNPMLDPIQQYLPWRIYAVESVRSGLIPLWNPYAYCGTPFLANLQSTVLYPLHALFLLAGARHGFGVSAILHLVLGGLFMFAFLRTLSLRPLSALFGALVVMFNGFVVTWLEFPTLSLWVFMWLPALLLCYERALRSPRSIWPVLCALVVGLQFLGGHLQISAYVLLAFLIYVLLSLARPESGDRKRGRALMLALLPLALGLALAAAQLLPTLELARYSGRVAHDAGAATSTAFPLSHLILYLVPNFFGNPADHNYWGHIQDLSALNFFETACYVGILPLLLAAWALRRPRRLAVWFFGGLTLFAVLVALGSPLYLLLYYLVPGFRELAGLGRVLCLAAFGFAGLAAIGLDDLLRSDAPRPARLPLLCGALAIVIVVGALAVNWPLVTSPEFREALPTFAQYVTRQALFSTALLILAVALVALRARLRLSTTAFATLAVALLIVDLFGHGIRFNTFVDPGMAYPDTDATQWLEDQAGSARVASLASDHLDWMAHNSPMIFGLRDIHGSDSLRVKRSFELVSGPDLDQAHYPPADSALLDALGVRYLITRQQLSGKWSHAFGWETNVYENVDAQPRAYLALDFNLGSDTEGRAALVSPHRDAIIHPDGVGIGLARRGSPAPEDTSAYARFLRDAPNDILIEADSQFPALLVLTDSYYPGWRARLYETPTPVLRANYAFRGVAVPAGKNLVTFTYDPASFRVGLYLSLVALAVLAAWALAVYIGKHALEE